MPTLPLASHAWHWPLQARLQQTPSMQFPVPHWFDAAQRPPLAFFWTQAPAEQKSPAMQSVSAEQIERQAVAPQR